MSIAVNVNDPTNSGVASTSGATGSSSLTGNSAADLQGSFLTLLVAQLKNQDPTNPMQNNELTTQLAQISTVSGIESSTPRWVPFPVKSTIASLCRPPTSSATV